MSIEPVHVNAETLQMLEFSTWNELSDRDRGLIAAELTDRINNTGRAFRAATLKRYGPDSDQAVIEWSDSQTEMVFTLIPGVEFCPGFSDEEMAQFVDVWRLMERDDIGPPPDEVRPHGSECGCSLRQRGPLKVSPMLLAAYVLPRRTMGIYDAAEMEPRVREFFATHFGEDYPVQLKWAEVTNVLRHYRWDLPTSDEYEWAWRAGGSGIFYWGNKIPDFAMMPEWGSTCGPWASSDEAVDDASTELQDLFPSHVDYQCERKWPLGNRFGLVGMGGWETWCAPSPRADDPFPMTVRGGAGNCMPWQGSGEWLTMLTAFESRRSLESDDRCALRPAVRLSEQ